MAKLPMNIFKDELQNALDRGIHKIPIVQMLNRFRLEGYGLEKARKWTYELVDLVNGCQISGPYIKF